MGGSINSAPAGFRDGTTLGGEFNLTDTYPGTSR
jgi:hypothetical protein